MISLVKASAPAKTILVGEHFVVAGCPAIAAAIDVRATVEAERLSASGIIEVDSRELGRQVFEAGKAASGPLYPVYVAASEVLKLAGCDIGLRLRVESGIPPSSGMGSSAAVAVATVTAVAALLGISLPPGEISRVAYAAETLVHGRPSGIDNTVSTYGGVIYYKRGEGFTKLKADLSPVRIILADSGIQRSTGELVSKVLALKARHASILDHVYEAAANLAEAAKVAIERGDYPTLGELMNINHGLLSAIGVSNAKLEELVYAARQAGALGAKITGAGGGGMVLALAWSEDAGKVAQALSRLSERVIVATISQEGARLEA